MSALLSYDVSESSDEIANPERGFYVGLNLLSTTSAAQVRASGHTLAIAIVRLDDYRAKPLDAAFLASLEAGFARVRASGVKVVLRFAYNASFSADAPRDVILNHIAQLKPVLAHNADVIAVMQAGFIGAWGEWHTSTNGLENDASRAAILDALLGALPASRMVQVRTPMYKGAYTGAALAAAEAFSGSKRARVGHHDDCFLASATDMGTYASSTWRTFVAQDSRFTPVGGETCAVSERTTCAQALDEMATNHWSFLNQEYQQEVLASFEAQGCSDEIHRRLGYRFALHQVAHSESVRPGGELALSVSLTNSGFAAPFNARPVYVVLSGNGVRVMAKLDDADVRRWEHGTDIHLGVRLQVPATVAAGTYRLSLWMPDAASSLEKDPRYAIRLANAGRWDAGTGENLLSEQVTVATDGPSTADPTAGKLVALR
jgi:hypothetical protein